MSVGWCLVDFFDKNSAMFGAGGVELTGVLIASLDELTQAQRDVFWERAEICFVLSFDRNKAIFEFEDELLTDNEFFKDLLVGEAMKTNNFGFAGFFDKTLGIELGCLKVIVLDIGKLFGSDGIVFLQRKDVLEGSGGLRDVVELDIGKAESVEGAKIVWLEV